MLIYRTLHNINLDQWHYRENMTLHMMRYNPLCNLPYKHSDRLCMSCQAYCRSYNFQNNRWNNRCHKSHSNLTSKSFHNDKSIHLHILYKNCYQSHRHWSHHCWNHRCQSRHNHNHHRRHIHRRLCCTT